MAEASGPASPGLHGDRRTARWRAGLSLTAVPALRAFGLALVALCTLVQEVHASGPAPDVEGSGRPIVRNYTYREFGAETQNWDVVQGETGIMYFANNAGVVEFDGRAWRLIELPARVAVRALAVADREEGRIYVGAQADLGYLAPDDAGRLQFRSVLPADEARDRRFTGLSRPVVTSSGLYFHLRNSLCRWNDGQLRCRETGPALTGIFRVGDQVYVQQQGVGLMQVVDTSLVPTPGGGRFSRDEIAVLLPHRIAGEDRLLVGTRRLGLFLQRGDAFEQFGPDLRGHVEQGQLVSGAVLPDGSIALGTRLRGVFVVDPAGVVRQHVDRATGLQDNHVHGIWPDQQGGLWLALQHGVSRVELTSPYSILDETSGLEREWREAVRHDGNLYVRGYKGLFVGRTAPGRGGLLAALDGPPSLRFSRVADIEPPVWAFVDVGHALLVTARDRIHAIRRGRSRRIAAYGSVPMALARGRSDPARVHVGLADGLTSVRFVDGTWIDEGRVDGIDEMVTSLAEGADGDLWLVARSQRILRVREARGPLTARRPPGAAVRRAEVHRFRPDVMTGRISVRTIAGRPVFLTETGILEFDEPSGAFVPVPALAALAAAGRRSFSWISEDPHGNVWVASRKPGGVDFLWKQPDGRYVVDNAGLRQIPVWSIFPDTERHLVWFSTPDYLLRYDPAAASHAQAPLRTLVRRVSANSGEVVFGGAAPAVPAHDGRSDPGVATLPASVRTLRFEFSAGSYDDPERNEFQSLLEGFDRGWSAWDREATRAFTNLRPGHYRLRVKARDAEGRIGEEASFAFSVLPPWYRTAWAHGLYLCLLCGALVLAWRLASRRAWLRLEHAREHLELEKLRELDRLKSQFFADVSHEFRTPLSLILAPVAQLLRETTVPDTRQKLELVRRHADYLMRLICQLLDLSRLEAHKMRLCVTPGDLAEEVSAIVSPFVAMARERGVHLRLDVPEGPGLRASFDRDILEKILNNLIGNALGFTRQGGSVTVSLRRLASTGPPEPRAGEEGKASFEVAVSDTGTGIAPEHLPHVFDRFYQAHGPSPREGFGIGLALVRELVELHGGIVTVDSELGRGTTFTVRLSLDVSEAEDAVAGLLPVPRATSAGEGVIVASGSGLASGPADEDSRASVLIVEDHADLRGFLREQLQPTYRVFEASDGSDGWRQATSLRPGLVLSDVMMRGMDGLALCRALKRDDRTAHIPVVLLTARAASEDRLRGLDFGADCYLVKPFEPPELLAHVHNLIEQRRLLRQRFSGSVVLKPSEMAVVPADQAFLARVLTVIETHLEDPAFDVEDLGRAVGLSRSQLHRKLRALTNQPPTLLIRSVRLQRAAELLAGQAGSVSEIAYRVGFNSQAYFAKCFRETFGVSPREHRVAATVGQRGGNGNGNHGGHQGEDGLEHTRHG